MKSVLTFTGVLALALMACESDNDNENPDALNAAGTGGSSSGFGGEGGTNHQAGGSSPTLFDASIGGGPDSGIRPDGGAEADPVDAAPPQPDIGEQPQPDAAPDSPASPGNPDSAPGVGACNARMQQHASEGIVHVGLCTNIAYKTNPPNSGNHYEVWAAYRTYQRTIPWGFLVHSLEHGAIVITYNCPQGCAEEVAQAQAFIDSLPVTCAGGVTRKLILMPDPTLDVRFAASAWLHTLKADCFDREAFQAFYDQRYNKGREDSCNQGTDPSGESNGGKTLCGL